MRFLPFLILWALTISAEAAFAQEEAPIEVDGIRCTQLTDLGEDEISFLLAWLDGDFNHMHGTTTLSDQSLTNLGMMIEMGCREAPDRHVLDMLKERVRQDALKQHP